MQKTIENLKAAFAGESQARNKYLFFAKVARKEGWQGIAEVFEETAVNEAEHALIILKLLKEIGDTKANLQKAITGETHEYEEMYPEFARIAEEEGFHKAAEFFKRVAEVEKHHAERFRLLLEMLEKGEFLEKSAPIKWQCRECGYIYEGPKPPEVCPLCRHSKEYYKPYCECY
ncbi:MAG: Rubrerythrin [Thermoanaerobacterales bacterium 50_218]|nr:MAG: Rubrerythrin [Thermoanaerobacterales bacterium 50_218]HAA89078.1 rubrerythrin [Peptococcaceae bacterium]